MRDKDETEIGATRGKRHDEVLSETLGRERGLRVATGATQGEGPVVDEGVVEKEKAARAEATSENQEITKKKLERHGDVGGER